MQSITKRTALLVFTLLWSSSVFGVPETINIQGNLERNSVPLLGTRAFQLQFYDAPADGTTLGTAINGFLTPSPAGRFSIEITPPAEVFSATEVYYQLGVDSANPTDGTIDSVDLFPDRVKVNSVLYVETVVRQGAGSGLDADLLDGVDSTGFADAAHTHNLQDLDGTVTDAQVPDDITIDHAASADSATMAGHTLTADTATAATTALALSGMLSNPGDQIPLGDDVFLQVAADGIVELLAGGVRLRLAGQKWFDPSGLLDNISPDGMAASGPQVAMNNNGDAVIVWQQRVGGMFQIFRSEYRNGAWSDPSSLTDNISPEGQDAFNPQVAINDSGDAVIVWEQSDGTWKQIFRSEYRNGSWNDPSDLADNISPDGQSIDWPDVAMNDSGDTVIVWEQRTGAKGTGDPIEQIYRSEYRNGVWSDPSSLSDNISPDGTLAERPQVAINAGSDAVIVWYQSDGTIEQIYRSEYRDGTWSDPSGLSDNISPDGTSAEFPQVALNENGDAVIVWYQRVEGMFQIYRSEYRDGAWSDPSSLSDNISPEGQVAFNPEVAMNDNGEAVIVWTQSDGANNQIFRSEFRFGF